MEQLHLMKHYFSETQQFFNIIKYFNKLKFKISLSHIIANISCIYKLCLPSSKCFDVYYLTLPSQLCIFWKGFTHISI